MFSMNKTNGHPRNSQADEDAAVIIQLLVEIKQELKAIKEKSLAPINANVVPITKRSRVSKGRDGDS